MPAVPPNYDPVQLNHWLWWKVKCFEAQGTEFQQMFERAMQRLDPSFVAVKPHGNVGDRKNDGMLFHEGTVYAVYSPDEYRQADLVAKIESDLAGALEQWKDLGLEKWVFVYNVRRGIGPDVLGILKRLQSTCPQVALDHLNSDALWERITKLPLQARCELLGAPIGYEHLFLASTELEVAQRLKDGAFVVIQDVMSPINLADANAALGNRQSFGPPLRARPEMHDRDWNAAAAFQRTLVEDALRRARDLLPRFAVFSLSPIPLAVHLGFLLSDRVEVEPYQFDRDRKTWAWPESPPDGAPVLLYPCQHGNANGGAVIRVSLSAKVTPKQSRQVVADPAVEVDIYVEQPDVKWLTSPAQLTEVAQAVRAALRICADLSEEVHLFLAVPTGAAIVVGQAINPRMCPPVCTYEFSFQARPQYQPALILTQDMQPNCA